MKICTVGAELFQADWQADRRKDGRTDGRTDVTLLTVAFRKREVYH